MSTFFGKGIIKTKTVMLIYFIIISHVICHYYGALEITEKKKYAKINPCGKDDQETQVFCYCKKVDIFLCDRVREKISENNSVP